jgi:hypothetical protein
MNFFRRSHNDDESTDSDESSHSEEATDDEAPEHEADAQEEDEECEAIESTPVNNSYNVHEEHSDSEDDESYETDDEEPKKRGWFGFLRGKKSESYDEESDEEEAVEPVEVDHSNKSPPVVNVDKPAVVEAEEEEIAQAIQRVQQRIADYRKKQANGVAAVEVMSDKLDEPVDADVKDVQNKNECARDVCLVDAIADEKEPESLNNETQESANDKVTELNDNMKVNATPTANENKPTLENNTQDEDDDPPSLSERRTLLSLAAEHNRVDVIKELLSMTDSISDRQSLLQGTEGTEFVPPPLHAAVAHGSIDAVACLLRMGADPSLRPMYDESNGEEGNYKKYHRRSAWELAFGSWIRMNEAESTKSKWFRFGSSKDNGGYVSKEGVRYKRIAGLNIPQAKLDGIHHAFTAEALRAIGSDEVDRLSQLIEAGMTPDIEVAGKTLKKWAGEMDAVASLALMMRGGFEEEEHDDEEEERDDTVQVTEGDDINADMTELDERLVGLSNKDIITLIHENESLIPALTCCRDDLAEETEMCQNILRDIQATGGKGGLTSHSLLDLVRSLKENRQDMEMSLAEWQRAWEEREDELDWFWEEAIGDELREEFSRNGVLDEVGEPLRAGMKPISVDATLQELNYRYNEANNRVATLRSSIASLAEESARYRDEIDNSGLSGALSLVRNLRSEVKELEEKISLAQAGESICRRKIELIQRRIGHPVNGDTEELQDFQLNEIAEKQNGEGRSHSPVNSCEPIESAVVSNHRVPTPEIFCSQTKVMQDGNANNNKTNLEKDTEAPILDDNTTESDDDDHSEEEAIASCSEGSVEDASSFEEDYEGVENAVDKVMHSEAHVEVENSEVADFDDSENDTRSVERSKSLSMKQSELRESGMSTAIVVR